MFGEEVKLPKEAPGMVGRIDGVRQVGATGDLEVSVRRSEKIPVEETGGITVKAAGVGLLGTLRGAMASGTWLNDANGRYPSVVLGHVAAERLGISRPGQQVAVGGRYFTVVGILRPLPLAPEIERAALVGWTAAGELLGFDGHPTAIYERSTDASVHRVRDLIPHSVDPQNPRNVQVSDPSSALQAKAATEGAFTGLLLGLGGVALLVGGVGVANTMIISVLERRHEIGLRRSMGATRGQIRLQFVTESLLLSGLGGIAGHRPGRRRDLRLRGRGRHAVGGAAVGGGRRLRGDAGDRHRRRSLPGRTGRPALAHARPASRVGRRTRTRGPRPRPAGLRLPRRRPTRPVRSPVARPPRDIRSAAAGPGRTGGRTSCFRGTASRPAGSGRTGVLTIHSGLRSEGWKGTPDESRSSQRIR